MNASTLKATIRTLLKDGEHIDQIVQVGIGRGIEVNPLRKAFKQASWIGFEPLHEFYQRWVGRYPGMLVAAAVGDHTGLMTIYKRQGRLQASSMWPRADEPEHITVGCVALDWFRWKVGLQESILLWLDCEGAEMAVLHGAWELLKKGFVRYLVVELTDDAKRSGWPASSEVRELIDSHSGKLLRQFGEGGEYDAVYKFPARAQAET